MSNTKNKKNARNGEAALSSPHEVEFINTGHAAQSRYLAALANPFASPAVPIPDSFLMAHVSKMGYETTLTGVRELGFGFWKNADEPTGDYSLEFKWHNGTAWSTLKQFNSEIGARLVAAGIAFEDVGRADAMQGTITYTQKDKANNGLLSEAVQASERTERNRGFGMIAYELMRRQALEFEGDAQTEMTVKFSTPTDIIARFVGIAETDGQQGFVEDFISNRNFCTTSSYPNHHAGVFSDIPHPDLDYSLATPSLTELAVHNEGHHSTALATAAHWVATAAGWAWKHKTAIANFVRKAPSYYQGMMNFGGSVVSTSGQIMAIGARTAPLALGL